MAITYQMAKLILAEHKNKKIEGQVLLLGRQTIFMTPRQAKNLLSDMKIDLNPKAFIEIDRDTMGVQEGLISDKSFFSLFTNAQVLTCDVSDYEKADVIFDLSDKIPADMEERFDFIYNGSVLDNVFDSATCIKNISRMLKPGGVVFHYEGMKHHGATYLKYTPEWFFDYYAVNQFNDCQAYVLTYFDYFKDYHVLQWDAFYEEDNQMQPTPSIRLPGESMVVAIVEKGANSTYEINPIQSTYRFTNKGYLEACERFLSNPRRLALKKILNPIPAEVPQQSTQTSRRPLYKKIKNKVRQKLFGLRKEAPEVVVKRPYEPTLGHEFIATI